VVDVTAEFQIFTPNRWGTVGETIGVIKFVKKIDEIKTRILIFYRFLYKFADV
jgi:hypothetical protein